MAVHNKAVIVGIITMPWPFKEFVNMILLKRAYKQKYKHDNNYCFFYTCEPELVLPGWGHSHFLPSSFLLMGIEFNIPVIFIRLHKVVV